MRIAINASTLRVAGGRSFAADFLAVLSRLELEDSIDAFVSGESEPRIESTDTLRIHLVPRSLLRRQRRFWLDNVWLPRRLEQLRIEAVASLGNVSLPIRLPQVVRFAWAHALCTDAEERSLRRLTPLRKRGLTFIQRILFRQRLRHASIVVPQTALMARKLAERYPETPRIEIIPPSVSLAVQRHSTSTFPMPSCNGRVRLACLSHFYHHKNLPILLELAPLIEKAGGRYQILTTIDPKQHPDAARFLRQVQSRGLGGTIHNLGELPQRASAEFLRNSDGLLLPTLLESFSATHLNSMYLGKAIFTSDRDFAREACGDCAFFFDPLSAPDILETLDRAFSQPDRIREVTARGRDRAASFPSWEEVARTYLRLLHEAAKSGNHGGRS